jgi:hypothetical protein
VHDRGGNGDRSRRRTERRILADAGGTSLNLERRRPSRHQQPSVTRRQMVAEGRRAANLRSRIPSEMACGLCRRSRLGQADQRSAPISDVSHLRSFQADLVCHARSPFRRGCRFRRRPPSCRAAGKARRVARTRKACVRSHRVLAACRGEVRRDRALVPAISGPVRTDAATSGTEQGTSTDFTADGRCAPARSSHQSAEPQQDTRSDPRVRRIHAHDGWLHAENLRQAPY